MLSIMSEHNVYSGIMSIPLQLNWAGWETDTYLLHKAGWSISAIQNPYDQKLQLALKYNPDSFRKGEMCDNSVYAVTESIHYDYYERKAMMGASRYHDYGPAKVNLKIRTIGREVYYETMGAAFPKFEPVNCEPHYAQMKIHRLEDLAHFAPSMFEQKQFIVPENSVDQLLSLILEKQQASRTKYFEEQLRDENVVKKIHAQILSV